MKADKMEVIGVADQTYWRGDADPAQIGMADRSIASVTLRRLRAMISMPLRIAVATALLWSTEAAVYPSPGLAQPAAASPVKVEFDQRALAPGETALLQLSLAGNDLYNGPIDDVWGPKTSEALLWAARVIDMTHMQNLALDGGPEVLWSDAGLIAFDGLLFQRELGLSVRRLSILGVSLLSSELRPMPLEGIFLNPVEHYRAGNRITILTYIHNYNVARKLHESFASENTHPDPIIFRNASHFETVMETDVYRGHVISRNFGEGEWRSIFLGEPIDEAHPEQASPGFLITATSVTWEGAPATPKLVEGSTLHEAYVQSKMLFGGTP